MDCSEARLDRIEAQRSADVSHEQWRQSYTPMNLIQNNVPTFGSRDFLQTREDMTMPARETEPMLGFLTYPKLSDLFDVAGEYVPMNPEIFSAVSSGNREFLKELRSNSTLMACLKNDQGDSILHLAAAWGHLEQVKGIMSECPCLLLELNSRDQLPLHVAACAGHFAVVKALVSLVTYFSARLPEEDMERLNLYVVKDKDGDTPLHAALKGRHLETAAFLVDADQQASFLPNEKGISPLYMALESGDVSLVKAMLKSRGNDGPQGQLEGKKFIAHVALKTKNIDILDVFLHEYPNLVDERDEKGMTCLSFAASIMFYLGVCNLLDRSTKNVYVCDDDGCFPIHMAAKNGHTEVVKEILKRCPDSKQLINQRGQNILHIAAKHGKHLLVYYLMEQDYTKHLSVGQDVDGNTPLHLAAINLHYLALLPLTLDVQRLCIRNYGGLTALDIVESSLESDHVYQKRMTVMVLLHAHATKGSEEPTVSLTKASQVLAHGDNKEYVNTLLVVAALVATVTFAAGFTIPGGFNSSAPNLGRAIMATNPCLFIFLLLDTLSMQSSVVAIATLLLAQSGDPTLVERCLQMGLPFLLFSLLSMPVVFFFGVVTAIGHVTWFLITISIISYLFFGTMLGILGSFVLLQLPYVHPLIGQYIRFLYLMTYKRSYGLSI